MNIRPWTTTEIRILRQNRRLSAAEIAKIVGRSAGAVRSARARHNLPRLKVRRQSLRSAKRQIAELKLVLAEYARNARDYGEKKSACQLSSVF